MPKFKSRKLRNDVLLVIGVLIIALIGFLIFTLTQKEGKFIVVSIDGEETGAYILSEDTENLIVSGENGEFENHLVIKDGKAYISDANCRDKICVSHRAISKVGETIVCLPHKVVVSVEGDR